MKKIKLSIILALFLMNKSQAQVKLQLSLMPDKKTYLVSMIPERSFSFPDNITGTGQITVRIPTNSRFIAGSIKSLQTGVEWVNSVHLESPKADPKHDYVSFSLKTMGTRNIPYEQSVETPLFTFRNFRNDCVGLVELISDNDPSVLKVVEEGYNVKNHLSIFGLKTEAVKGIAESKADCNAVSTHTQDLDSPLKIFAAYPIPAQTDINIEYQNTLSDAQNMQLIITDIVGKEVKRQNLPLSKNLETTSISLTDWSAGLYLLRIADEKGRVSASQKFVVTK